MGKPVIAYKNILRNAVSVVTASSTDPLFSVGDIYDYRSYSVWKASSNSSPQYIDIDAGVSGQSCDYVLLVNHSLNTEGAAVQLQSGTTFPPTTTTEFTAWTPSEDGVSYKSFAASATRRYWRLTMTAGPFTNAPFIGEFFLGLKTELPQYLAPTFDPFFKQIEVQGVRSRGGHYLGASLRGQQHRGDITFGDAGTARADFTSDLNAFLNDHAFLRFPFGFIVDPDDGDFKAPRYVKMADEEEALRRAVGGTWQNLALSLPVEEAYAEPAS